MNIKLKKEYLAKPFYCNKCESMKEGIELNDLELKELNENGSFVCSDCINDEMKGEKK